MIIEAWFLIIVMTIIIGGGIFILNRDTNGSENGDDPEFIPPDISDDIAEKTGDVNNGDEYSTMAMGEVGTTDAIKCSLQLCDSGNVVAISQSPSGLNENVIGKWVLNGPVEGGYYFSVLGITGNKQHITGPNGGYMQQSPQWEMEIFPHGGYLQATLYLRITAPEGNLSGILRLNFSGEIPI